METLLAVVIWIAFATLTAIAVRLLAIKWAEKRGWTALTMPMSYHVWWIMGYLVIVQVAWILLYVFMIK